MVNCSICGKLTSEDTKLKCYRCNAVYCSDACAMVGKLGGNSNVCKVMRDLNNCLFRGRMESCRGCKYFIGSGCRDCNTKIQYDY